MSDPIAAKLIVSGKALLQVELPPGKRSAKREGGPTLGNIPERELSADILKTKQESIALCAGLEVEFELVNGQPARVRLKGKPFIPPASQTGGQRTDFRARAGGVGTRDRSFNPRSEGGFAAGSRRPDSRPGNQGGAPKRPSSAPLRPQGDFHNPYNFIPAPPRIGESDLRDRLPDSHARYHPDRWSGSITVELETKTPLLIPDAARTRPIEGADPEHKGFPVRLGPDGLPYLPPTSIKGMLRSAYEAITNSRFGVFGDHEERLAFRMPTKSGLAMVPARIEQEGSGLVVRLLPGTSEIGREGEPSGRLMYGAWLAKYYSAAKTWKGLDVHEAEVWAYLTRWDHGNFRFWNVTEMRPASSPNPPSDVPEDRRRSWKGAAPIPETNEMKDGEKGKWVRGYVCITGQNIDAKHDERVFFEGPRHPQSRMLRTPLTSQLEEAWKALIADYQSIHERERAAGQERPSALKRAKWSRHIVGGSAELKLRNGSLVHARVRSSAQGFEILGLYPVMISRDLHPSNPASLLDESLKPARMIENLSPADRVFGWVRQKGQGGSSAWRGQLSIGPVACLASRSEALESFGTEGFPLAILGQPKPQQARFYVAADKEGRSQVHGAEKHQVGYESGKGLRGRKVYPHQKGAPEDEQYWQQPMDDRTQQDTGGYYQEYRRPTVQDDRGRDITRDNQNRSILEFVKPKVKFEFNISLTNLSSVELGALIWLLNLDTGHYLKLGGGKPLGFGSVHLRIRSLDVRNGGAWRQRYRSLTTSGTAANPPRDLQGDPLQSEAAPLAIADAGGAKCLVEEFKKAVALDYKTGFESVRFVAAFLRAAQGFEDGKPTRYPRAAARPDPKGEAFKWFVANEKREAGFVLGNLEDDQGLPQFSGAVRPGGRRGA